MDTGEENPDPRDSDIRSLVYGELFLRVLNEQIPADDIQIEIEKE